MDENSSSACAVCDERSVLPRCFVLAQVKWSRIAVRRVARLARWRVLRFKASDVRLLRAKAPRPKQRSQSNRRMENGSSTGNRDDFWGPRDEADERMVYGGSG